jgi:hypothetical protein
MLEAKEVHKRRRRMDGKRKDIFSDLLEFGMS